MSAYLILFWTAFGAATILPFYSEIVLLALLNAGHDTFGLWLTATIGNTLGSVVNWVIGRQTDSAMNQPWMPISTAQLERGRQWFNRYGYWSLLLAWLPVGGDALTFVGGVMRVRFTTFVYLVGLGKSARYAVIVLGWQAISG